MTAALNQFISRSVDKCRPFFLLLHKWKEFEWFEEYAVAFQQLKEYLSDLMVEFAECPEEMNVEQHGMDEKSVGLISAQCPSPWKVYVDGAANQKGSGVGLVLVSPEEITIEKSLRSGFSVTNNEAEYEALLMGMVMV